MMYFWIIPLLLLLILTLVYFFYRGTKRNPTGPSRLDEAQADERRSTTG